MGSDALIVIGHHGVVGIAEAHPFFAEEVGCGIAEYSERIVVHCGSCHTHTGGAGSALLSSEDAAPEGALS